MIWRDERCAALRLSVPGGHVEDCVCGDVAVRNFQTACTGLPRTGPLPIAGVNVGAKTAEALWRVLK